MALKLWCWKFVTKIAKHLLNYFYSVLDFITFSFIALLAFITVLASIHILLIQPYSVPDSTPLLLSLFQLSDIPDQVIRVFKADQQSCYIIISKDTTAKDVVAHTVNEFGLIAAPETYSLCEVSVSPEGVIKQRRLPDQLSKLADRIQLNGR